MSEIDVITNQVINGFSPNKIILFGSRAKGNVRATSDYDICIIANTDDKRAYLTRLYCEVNSDYPIDFLLYTPTEWEDCVNDKTSFAHKISKEGIVLYGGQ